MEAENNPTVSVWMTTYNHERFISLAIESVLMQETSFKIELVIGEDCSIDKTREIVLMYKEKFPEIIKLVLPDSNQGMMRNAINTFNECSGKYIAILEGDDYWIDSLKLQKQVVFLEHNKDFVLSCHNTQIINENGDLKGFFNKSPVKNVQDFNDIIKKWELPTASMVFRRECLDLPDWLYQVPNGDLSIILILARKGKINYFEDVMGAYRKHSSGASVIVNDNSIKYLQGHKLLWQKINEYYNYTHNSRIRRKIFFVNCQIIKQKLLRRYIILQQIKKKYHYIKSSQ